MTIPYWLTSTLNALPAVLWMFAGLGIPLALAALPRKDWSDRGLVGALALAFGPAAMTAWLFVLGTVGGANQSAMLTAPYILGGSLVIFMLALAVVAYKRRTPAPDAAPRKPFTLDEKLIIALIAAAMVIRWITTAYWPFIHYDPLWVYGYQGRLFSLQGFISPDIGYYPQFLQLQYVYTQVVTGAFFPSATGKIYDDHVARAVIPFLHLGSILIVYALGSRLFTRRVGIIAAGLWGLYPHVGSWATVGDLEIPTMYGFTGAAAFFLAAWMSTNPRTRRHYAALAGLFLGIAMWTKPTAGAFILGVVLMVGVAVILWLWYSLYPPALSPTRGERELFGRGKFSSPFRPEKSPSSPVGESAYMPRDLGGEGSYAFRSRFEVAVITGIFSIPLGALWYVRNWMLGHEPLVFPHEFWLTQALRSGVEFGWPLLALALLLVVLWLKLRSNRPNMLLVMAGAVVFFVSLLPTIIEPRRMTEIEFAGLGAGVVLLAAALLPYLRRQDSSVRHKVAIIGWAAVLALPYFLNWFWNYSYHYRLSFAIVPLMLLPSAVLLDTIFKRERVTALRRVPRWAYAAAILLVSLPAVVIPLYSFTGGWDYLWSDEFPTDWDRVASFNGALAYTVRDIENAIIEDGFVGRGDTPVIVAPGLQRLPFFFPEYEVRIEDTPTTFDELADVDYYIYTQEAVWLYEDRGLSNVNQVVGAINRPLIYDYFSSHGDPTFWSQSYRVKDHAQQDHARQDLAQRFDAPEDMTALEDTVIFGDFARLSHYRIYGENRRFVLGLAFEALHPTERDYVLAIEWWRDGEMLASSNGFLAASPRAYYSTRVWDTDEYVIDRREMRLPRGMRPQAGDRLRVAFYIPANGDPLSTQDATFAPVSAVREPAARKPAAGEPLETDYFELVIE